MPSFDSAPSAIRGLFLPTSSATSSAVMFSWAGSQITFRTGDLFESSVGSKIDVVTPGMVVNLFEILLVNFDLIF